MMGEISVRWSRRWRGLAALLQAGLLTAVLLTAGFSAGAPAYRVTGQVVSLRDGAPVPYCRVSATPSPDGAQPAMQAAQAGPGAPRSGGPRFGPGGRPLLGRPGMARGGRATATPAYDQLEIRADASGHFSLELPHAGRWRVMAEARGFAAQDYDAHEGFFSSIVLSETDPVFHALFRLAPDGVIGGLILDEAGDPVVRAQVSLERVTPSVPGEPLFNGMPRTQPAGATQSDDQGRYELAGLMPGEYRVRVQAQPWYANGARGQQARPASDANRAAALDPSLDVVFPVTWFPSALTQDGAENIVLTGAGEERQADFHLAAIPAAHLLISRPDVREPTAAEGRVATNRPVSITRVGSDDAMGQTTFIGGNGRDWEFGSLTPGTYEVRVPGPAGEQDGEVRQIEVRPGSTVATLESAVSLTPVRIAFDGSKADSIFAILVDASNGRRIVAAPQPRQRGAPGGADDASTDARRELLVALAPHRYFVYLAQNAGAYLAGISAQGAETLGRTIAIGDTPAAVTLHVATGRGEIAGFVRSADGKPDVGAMVLLVPATLGQPGEDTPILRDQTDTDGSYRITGVIPGRYILVAIDHGWQTPWRTMQVLARYLAQGIPVELQPGAKLTREVSAILP